MTSIEQQLQNAKDLVLGLQEKLRIADQQKCGLSLINEQDAKNLDHYGSSVSKGFVGYNGSFSNGINFFTSLHEGDFRMATKTRDGKTWLCVDKYVDGKWLTVQRLT